MLKPKRFFDKLLRQLLFLFFQIIRLFYVLLLVFEGLKFQLADFFYLCCVLFSQLCHVFETLLVQQLGQVVQEDDTLSAGFHHSLAFNSVIIGIFDHVTFKYSHKFEDKLCLVFKFFIFFDEKLFCLYLKPNFVLFQIYAGFVVF